MRKPPLPAPQIMAATPNEGSSPPGYLTTQQGFAAVPVHRGIAEWQSLHGHLGFGLTGFSGLTPRHRATHVPFWQLGLVNHYSTARGICQLTANP